jgi:hypothetical protein
MDAYLHSSGTWGCILPQFSCFDVRSPTSPQPMRWQVDEWPDHRLNTGWNERNGTAFNDRFIAARNNLSNGPDEIWFLEPMSASPRWIKPIAWQDRFSSIIDLAFVDDYLVVLEFDGTVSIFDIGDGLLPVTIGSNYVEQGTDLVGGHEIALAVSWQVGPGPGYSVIAIDLQNPASPTQHDLTQDLQWDQVHQLHLIGRTAIVLVDTGGKTRLMEIDLSVPSSPRIIGSRPHLGRIMAATDRFIAVTSTGSSQLTFHKRNPRRQSRNQNIAVGASDGVE